jgi:hypothetical protein
MSYERLNRAEVDIRNGVIPGCVPLGYALRATVSIRVTIRMAIEVAVGSLGHGAPRCDGPNFNCFVARTWPLTSRSRQSVTHVYDQIL